MSKRLFTLAVCIGMASNTLADEPGQTVPESAEDQPTLNLQSVVVSGEKQDRSLKNTTSSVSVVNDEKLRSTQYQTVRDAISDVPNLITGSGVVPTIRGISGNGAAGGFNGVSGGANARVSTLVDGVAIPFLAEYTADSGLWDIEQIEVYRGPQSTNNGRNSIGGAIYIQTKDPSFDWDSAIRLGYRNEDRYLDQAVMLSGPIIEDKLAIRISGQYLNAQTTTNNEEYETNPADFDLNELETTKGRIKLLWLPMDNLEALFTYSVNEEEGDTARRYYELAQPYEYNKIFINDTKTEHDIASLKLDYHLSDNLSFDILLANMDYEYGFETYKPTVEAQQDIRIEEGNNTIDAKLNFGKMNPTLNGFLGFAYYDREQDILSTGAFTYNGDDETDTKAVYGEINYAVLERFTLTGGMRYQDESQKRRFRFPPNLPDYSYLDESNSIFLPKLVLQYDVTDQTRVALSARKGYNSAGGALNFFTREYYYYDEETVNTYEFSTHSDLSNGAVVLRTNLFYNDYDGYQAQNSSRTIINVDQAVTYGAEIEATAFATSDLLLNLGIGLLKTEVKDGGDDFPGIDGNELNYAPRTTATFGATYYITEGFDIGGSLQYVGGYYGDVENTDEREIGGYSLVDMSTNYETGSWLISAYINNLTDKQAERVKEPVGRSYPLGFADIVEGRHAGVSATYSFF